MDYAFKYIKDKGETTETAYPYKAKTMSCTLSQGSKPIVAHLTGFTDVQVDCPADFLTALSQRVVSIAVDAQTWQFYRGGIFSFPFCGTSLDHGVNAVGYGTEKSKTFIKVRNSWSSSWGEKGYIRLHYKLAPGKGECGIFMAPSYPTGCTYTGN